MGYRLKFSWEEVWGIIVGYASVRYYFDGWVQERRNSSALAMELRLSFTNTSIKTSFDGHNVAEIPLLVAPTPHLIYKFLIASMAVIHDDMIEIICENMPCPVAYLTSGITIKF